MMKMKMFVFAVLCVIGCAMAAEPVASGKVGPISFFSPTSYLFQYGLSAQTQQNHYKFFVARKKSDGKRPETNSFLLTSGNPTKYGFCTAGNFLSVKVNGIPHNKIMLKTEDFSEFSGTDFKGSSLKMNFDGCIVHLKTYMKSNSPLLFFTLEPDADTLEPLKSCEIVLTCTVSGLMFEGKKVLFDKAYHKEALTAKRTIAQLPQKQNVTAEDRYVVMRDTVLNGTAEKTGEGPSAVYFGALSGVAKAQLHLRDFYETTLTFQLVPDFKKFEFAILQYPAKVSNDEMQKRIQALPEFK